MLAAESMGIAAQEEGLCIHFDPPRNMEGLKQILHALHRKNLVPADEELPDPLLMCC
jgi:hypothetical protein